MLPDHDGLHLLVLLLAWHHDGRPSRGGVLEGAGRSLLRGAAANDLLRCGRSQEARRDGIEVSFSLSLPLLAVPRLRCALSVVRHGHLVVLVRVDEAADE